MRKKVKIRSSKELFQGRIFSFVAEDLILPNDRRTEMAFIRHPGSSAIVPLLDEKTVIMELQYRHPVGEYVLEIPAGTMEPGESPLKCAKRELEEETGFVAAEFIELAQVHIIPAYSDEKIYVYLARGLTPSKQNLDQDEIITVVKHSLEKTLRMINDGRITDALTILSLQKAWFYIQNKNKTA